MRIYIFRSTANTGLRAFTDDVRGAKLPDQFGPWNAIGVVATEKEPPYKLSREHIEKAIGDCGYQLWRMKPKAMAE